jgi:hypothetical protein
MISWVLPHTIRYLTLPPLDFWAGWMEEVFSLDVSIDGTATLFHSILLHGSPLYSPLSKYSLTDYKF